MVTRADIHHNQVHGTVGIVGLGLIGGSLARRLAHAGVDVIAWNRHHEPYAQAARDGIRCVPDLTDVAAAKPDVIVLCNPLKAMPAVLAALEPAIDRDVTTLTDVGSVKGMVRDQVMQAGLNDCYVGAHPMAGNELSGWSAADPALYDGALWAITVDDRTPFGRFRQVAALICSQAGNQAIVLDDETHDRAAAMISHMPHVVATALINELTDNPDRNIAAALAAGSWRDMTRVALTDPDRTRAMVDEDAINVEALLRSMAARLTAVADALQTGDDAVMTDFFADGQPFRDYKARLRAADAVADTPDSTRRFTLDIAADAGSATDWRRVLLDSARAGERIVDIDDAGTVRVISRAAFPEA
ncbi:prephenate dehydrogenase [Bifidobacterium leontopitheci]|uniref:Prephenate dehydrogenase n=1 Tax=Bifidobacterium leontopitheci TaxID=2650774 RepID=A0A6I1GY39_9BIFI|nr:prephenate dehydrogenase/arogenate dehydrogenase family protein [Bifidobacterium leontopitheci]KAB7791371.1 prephenate dehydrogenase [Bifidobacterium leontopitheci]